MPRKWNEGTSVGLVIVCLCLITPLTVAGISPSYKVSTVVRDPIVFHNTPENGLYWNDQKVANYPVPVYLHYHLKHNIPLGISVNTSEIPALIMTGYNGGSLVVQTGAPFGWPVRPLPVPYFGHSPKLTVIVIFQDGRAFWDNLTVYRLFP